MTTRISAAFATGRPAFVYFITAGEGDIASVPDTPFDAQVAKT